MANNPVKASEALMTLKALPPESMFTPSQAATFLAVSENTLARMRVDGIGPKYAKSDGADGSIEYRKHDLSTWRAAVNAGGKAS